MDETTFETHLHSLKADRARGASELARYALRVLYDSARSAAAEDVDALRDLLLQRAAALASSRPSMAPLVNLVGRWQEQLAAIVAPDLERFRNQATANAEQLIAGSRQAVSRIALQANHLLTPGKTVITHSFSSTLVEVFYQARHLDLKVIVSESRPLNEGVRLAKELARMGLDVTLITDAQIGLFAAKADLALVGADALLADGSVVNKAGTCLMALACRAHRIPFYVVCETFKKCSASQALPELEEMTGDELEHGRPPGIRVRNIYFDVTPASLVSGWLNETGLRTLSGQPLKA